MMIAVKLPFYVAVTFVFQEIVEVGMVDTLRIICGTFQESVSVQLVNKRSPTCEFANFIEGKQVNQGCIQDVGFDEQITTNSY